ncbi:MAG TPA: HAD-IIIA family hydrolase, partial [Candidatus Poseidoniales archaeon]
MDGAFVQTAPLHAFQKRTESPVAFLDRDGVLNLGKAGYVNHPEEVQLLDGSAEVIAALRGQGYLICVVTNQSPMARGLWGPERLELLHTTLQELLLEQ